MAGLGSARLSANDPVPPPLDLDPIEVDLGSDEPDMGAPGAIAIELPDGSVEINLGPPAKPASDAKFDSNLAEHLTEGELSLIADELLDGIEADMESRREWMDNRAEGIKLLGLKIENAMAGSADASPVEGTSQYRDTMLLEAVIRFQANARSELLPTDGPVKVRNDDPGTPAVMPSMGHNGGPPLDDDGNDLADALEKDMNHYLTAVDKDFVTDTDALLFRIGLDGCGFKKVYHDPIKRRPVSLSVNAEDVIVSNAAVSLHSAARITHRFFMRPSVLKRMQIVGAYRDIDIPDPDMPQKSVVDEETESATGLNRNSSSEPNDREYELYECYCELIIPGFEHKIKGKATGLAIPFKVVIERHSRIVLEIRRNWVEDDEMCLPTAYFVKFPFMTGLGFYGIGLSQILGNTTNAVTAAKREFIDAGMFANFPGFLYAKSVGKQNTTTFRVPPGGGASIDTGGQPIGSMVMPLPYKEPGPVFVQFIDSVSKDGARLGGTAELSVGEGRQDAPVGTTIAMIEQATKPMDAVHKRLHAAQAEEFALLVQRFREDPESFWRNNKKARKPWNEEMFLKALDDHDLVPQADPNTSSHMQRVAKFQALYMMAKDDPSAFDLLAVRRAALKALGFSHPDMFFAPPQAAQPDPKTEAAQMSAKADLIDAETKRDEIGYKMKRDETEDENRDKDRVSDERIAELKLETERVIHHTGLQADALSAAQDRTHDLNSKSLDALRAPEPGLNAPLS